jgi:hypothetical protein
MVTAHRENDSCLFRTIQYCDLTLCHLSPGINRQSILKYTYTLYQKNNVLTNYVYELLNNPPLDIHSKSRVQTIKVSKMDNSFCGDY